MTHPSEPLRGREPPRHRLRRARALDLRGRRRVSSSELAETNLGGMFSSHNITAQYVMLMMVVAVVSINNFVMFVCVVVVVVVVVVVIVVVVVVAVVVAVVVVVVVVVVVGGGGGGGAIAKDDAIQYQCSKSCHPYSAQSRPFATIEVSQSQAGTFQTPQQRRPSRHDYNFKARYFSQV